MHDHLGPEKAKKLTFEAAQIFAGGNAQDARSHIQVLKYPNPKTQRLP